MIFSRRLQRGAWLLAAFLGGLVVCFPAGTPRAAPALNTAPPPVADEQVPAEKTPSGQPVPRFVSLRAKEVNMRVGPGTRYRVNWVYRQAGLPVEVVAEYDNWRKIRDADGVSGWVHRTMLSGARSVITLEEEQVLRAKPNQDARPLLRVGPNVIGYVMGCPENSGFCRVTIAGRVGWLPRSSFWGVYPGEKVE